MNTSLDYRNRFLCVLADDGIQQKCWFPVIEAEHSEVRTLLGRPVTQLDPGKGTYVDEEGNVFQLLDKGDTKPIEVEHLPATEKTELELLLQASLKEEKTHEQNGDSKKMQPKNRPNGRKRQVLPTNGAALQLPAPETTVSAQPSH